MLRYHFVGRRGDSVGTIINLVVSGIFGVLLFFHWNAYFLGKIIFLKEGDLIRNLFPWKENGFAEQYAT